MHKIYAIEQIAAHKSAKVCHAVRSRSTQPIGFPSGYPASFDRITVGRRNMEMDWRQGGVRDLAIILFQRPFCMSKPRVGWSRPGEQLMSS